MDQAIFKLREVPAPKNLQPLSLDGKTQTRCQIEQNVQDFWSMRLGSTDHMWGVRTVPNILCYCLTHYKQDYEQLCFVWKARESIISVYTHCRPNTVPEYAR